MTAVEAVDVLDHRRRRDRRRHRPRPRPARPALPPRREGRPRDGHERPLPRPAPLGRPLRRRGSAGRPRVHRREPRSCGGSPRPASRTPAAASSRRRRTPTTTRTGSRRPAPLRASRATSVPVASLLRPRARPQPGDQARVPRPGRRRRAVAADRGKRRRRRGRAAARPGPTTGSSRWQRIGGRILDGRRRRRAERHRHAGSRPRSSFSAPARGPGSSPAWPARPRDVARARARC